MKRKIKNAEKKLHEAALEFAHAFMFSSSHRYHAAEDELFTASIEYAKAVEEESESQCKPTTS